MLSIGYSQIENMGKLLGVGIVSAVFSITFSLASSAHAADRYVTHFEQQSKVTYAPHVRMVEKTFTRRSWNPFNRATKIERKMVPVVSWKPTRTTETVPITERVAIKNPRQVAQKEERQFDGVKSIDRLPTRSFQTRSIAGPAPPNPRTEGSYGGIQRLDLDAPRYGMKLRTLR